MLYSSLWPARAEHTGVELGRGAHAVVYSVRGCDGSMIAVKQFRRRATEHARGEEEFVFAHRCLAHAHVVRVLALDAAEGWLAMELVDGCSLAEVMDNSGALREEHIVYAVTDVLAGLTAFHEHGVPHRDVKPGNVMQDRRSGRCKLVDWIGQAAEDESLRQGKPVGTPVFMAPEVAGRPHRHGIASDTWALGCMVVNLASGRLPWAEADTLGRTNEFMAMWRAAQGHAPPHNGAGWSAELRAFVARCFEPDPARRAHAHELRQDPLLETV